MDTERRYADGIPSSEGTPGAPEELKRSRRPSRPPEEIADACLFWPPTLPPTSPATRSAYGRRVIG